MATLLDLIVERFQAPAEAAARLPEDALIQSALAAAPTPNSWQVFWRVVSECYATEDDLAMALGINDVFTDTAFVG